MKTLISQDRAMGIEWFRIRFRETLWVRSGLQFMEIVTIFLGESLDNISTEAELT